MWAHVKLLEQDDFSNYFIKCIQISKLNIPSFARLSNCVPSRIIRRTILKIALIVTVQVRNTDMDQCVIFSSDKTI